MTNLTTEKCITLIERLSEDQRACRISIFGELYLQALEIALPVLEQQGGWISCSDRMPEIGDRVLIPSSSGRNTIEAARFESNKFNRFGVEVIADHWMPIPTPPQPQPSTNPQIDNDGWIEWGGGECPVPKGTLVDVRLRDGSTEFSAYAWGQKDDVSREFNSSYAGWAFWLDEGDECDIIAYRVIENDGSAK